MRSITLYVLYCAFSPLAFGQAGVLDPTFSGDGLVAVGFDGGYNRCNAIAVQPDGKIIAAGTGIVSNSYDFTLARFNTDGSLDASFSGDGKVSTSFSSSGTDEAFTVEIQNDGKILAAGKYDTGPSIGAAVARYHPDGTLDTSFSGDGRFTFSIYEEKINDVAIQADGKILLAGYSINEGMLARLLPDGSLDTTFGIGGISLIDFTIGSECWSVLPRDDGRITVVGEKGTYGRLWQFTEDGVFDTTFVDNGATNPLMEYASGIRLTSGSILVVGNYGNPIAMARKFNEFGAIDSTFGVDGTLTLSSIHNNCRWSSAAEQADGRLILGGWSGNSGSFSRFCMVRLEADGTLDTSFGTDGWTYTLFGTDNDYDYLREVRIDPMGRIVVGGTVQFPGPGIDWFGVARYGNDVSVDVLSLQEHTACKPDVFPVPVSDGEVSLRIPCACQVRYVELVDMWGRASNAPFTVSAGPDAGAVVRFAAAEQAPGVYSIRVMCDTGLVQGRCVVQ